MVAYAYVKDQGCLCEAAAEIRIRISNVKGLRELASTVFILNLD